MSDLAGDIAASPVFAGLAPRLLEEVAGCASPASFAAGEALAREGSAADTFHLIRRGRVALEVVVPGQEPVIIDTIEAGDVIGWSWLFPPFRWHFDVRAVELTRTVSFDAGCLRAAVDSDDELGSELMRRFAEIMVGRLQAARLRLIDVYGHRGTA